MKWFVTEDGRLIHEDDRPYLHAQAERLFHEYVRHIGRKVQR